MTGFEIVWSEPALRQLRRLERPIARRVFERVGDLRKDPYRHVTRLVNSPYYRLRVGDYRVILDIERALLRVLVLKVGHRKSMH